LKKRPRSSGEKMSAEKERVKPEKIREGGKKGFEARAFLESNVPQKWISNERKKNKARKEKTNRLRKTFSFKPRVRKVIRTKKQKKSSINQ